MRYFLIAGEASGDLHAAMLITAIKHNDPNAEFCFLGGDKMESASSTKPIVHYRNMAYMGFIEVIKHLKQILGIMAQAKKSITDFNPDALILIDYPSFNLKMAKYAQSKNIPVFYYISPKVWAWKEYRVKKIKRYVNELYAIFPFEVSFYKKHNYNVKYVGNPSVEEIDEAIATIPSFYAFCSKHHLDPQKKIIAVLPGSRKKEIINNLPEMLKAAQEFPEYQIVISGAPGIKTSFYDKVLMGVETIPPIVNNDTYALVRNSRAALVTSGTATLETALLGTPQIACYRMSGNKWVFKFFASILKVKFVTLPNLIVDKEVIPELLLHNCYAENLASKLKPLLSETSERQKMLDGYNQIRITLGNNNSANGAALAIIDFLNRRNEQR